MQIFLVLLLLLWGLSAAHASEERRAAHWFVFGKSHLVFDRYGCSPRIDSSPALSGTVLACLADTNGELAVRLEGNTFISGSGAILADTLPRYLNISSLTTFGWRTVIIPKPGSDNFIAFSIRNELNKPRTLYYREISFTKMRTVAVGAILPDSAVTDFCIVENAARIGYWLVMSFVRSDVVASVPVTTAGVEATPKQVVMNNLPHTRSDFGGDVLNFSPDGKTVARVTLSRNVLLYDYDLATGVCSNERSVSLPGTSRYDTEFSPDGSKLFVNLSGAGVWIVQLDLSRRTAADIQASVADVARHAETAYWTEGDIQLAPNGRIYFAAPVVVRTVGSVKDTNYYLGEIACPNEPGIACQPDIFAIKLRVQYDLPRFVYTWFNQERTFGSDESKRYILCEGEAFAPLPTLLNCAQGYWLAPDMQRLQVVAIPAVQPADSGVYLFIQYRCGDTAVSSHNLVVSALITPKITLSAPMLCAGDSVIARIDGMFSDILWDNGTQGAAAVYRTAGVHTVSYMANGCVGTGVVCYRKV